MAVISVRLSEEEERILEYLTDYFHEDKSTLLRKSMHELFEDIQDITFIESYIEDSKNKKRRYVSAEELLD